MAIKFLNQVVKGVKGGISGTLKGTADVSSTIVNSVKNVAVTTIKGAGATDAVKSSLADSIDGAKKILDEIKKN